MNFGGTLRINKFACFTLAFVLFLIIYWRSGGSSYPTDKNDLINLKTLLKAAIHAAEYGGGKVAEGTRRDLNVKSKGKTKEGVNDPVTDADYASHCVMYYSLRNTFPKLTIVSEEHSKNDPKCENQMPFLTDTLPAEHHSIYYLNDELVFAKDITIWIDPLDATKEYTEGLYQYVTTMVCVAYKGIPIIGVIHYPFPTQNPQTYWGWLAKKTSSNVANVAHKEENKEHPRVVVSISHQGRVSDMAKEAFGPKTTVSTAAGAGYKVMGVVNGTYDVYLHTTAIKKWDLCAGDAIIRTVDGKMTTSNGEPITYYPDANEKVTDGVLVTRYDHSYYLSRISKTLSGHP
ncbi:putative inositol monophosphatase 3 [Battus philenor]|uniref:putative inositol monophosphatase 3 n=1 Tax=Battus philenor TaxID=42288 RepID=UPI0035D03D84